MDDASMTPPRVSVVIVSYNVRDFLESCLRSVEAATVGLSREIIVIDNASGDDSVAMVRALFPEVTLITSEINLGFARANNRGFARATGEYLFILNPDTLVQEDTVTTLVSFLDAHPEVGLAGCRIITPEGKLEPACRRSFPSPWVSFTKLSGLSHLFPRSRWFGRYNLTWMPEDETYEVDAVSGSCMMMRRSVYDAIGGFDEDYFMYGEDLDLCHRVKTAGYAVSYVHTTSIIHYGGQSTKRSRIDATSIFYQAMELFARKNLSLSAPALAVIRIGIAVRRGLTRLRDRAGRLAPALLDASLAGAALFAGEYVRFGTVFAFPDYAYPTVYLVSMGVTLLCLAGSGVYRRPSHPRARAALAVFASFLVQSALPFFFKEYAFSRAVVLVASLLNLLTIPGWRSLLTLLRPDMRESMVLGTPSLFVGVDPESLEALDRLRTTDIANHRIIGLIDTSYRHVGRTVAGLPVLGSTENLGKIIAETRVTDVLFAPDVLRYTEILALIAATGQPRLRYRLAPRPSISRDALTLPELVDVEYRLLTPSAAIMKRGFDLSVGILALAVALPASVLEGLVRPSRRRYRSLVRKLGRVLSGSMSLVGYPVDTPFGGSEAYLGKPGITGIAQIRGIAPEQAEDIRILTLQYARNYTLLADIEIVVRALAVHLFPPRS